MTSPAHRLTYHEPTAPRTLAETVAQVTLWRDDLEKFTAQMGDRWPQKLGYTNATATLGKVLDYLKQCTDPMDDPMF